MTKETEGDLSVAPTLIATAALPTPPPPYSEAEMFDIPFGRTRARPHRHAPAATVPIAESPSREPAKQLTTIQRQWREKVSAVPHLARESELLEKRRRAVLEAESEREKHRRSQAFKATIPNRKALGYKVVSRTAADHRTKLTKTWDSVQHAAALPTPPTEQIRDRVSRMTTFVERQMLELQLHQQRRVALRQSLERERTGDRSQAQTKRRPKATALSSESWRKSCTRLICAHGFDRRQAERELEELVGDRGDADPPADCTGLVLDAVRRLHAKRLVRCAWCGGAASVTDAWVGFNACGQARDRDC
jgi:hypothetical protein